MELFWEVSIINYTLIFSQKRLKESVINSNVLCIAKKLQYINRYVWQKHLTSLKSYHTFFIVFYSRKGKTKAAIITPLLAL